MSNECSHGQLKRQCQICELEAEVRELRAYKAGIEATFRRVMDEKCPADEVHCTCVPILRNRIRELETCLTKARSLIDEAMRND